MNELTKIRKNQKDKITQMEKQQEILLKNTNGHKVSQIIGYVDKQRNIYRSNTKQLLNKLDPDRRALGKHSTLSINLVYLAELSTKFDMSILKRRFAYFVFLLSISEIISLFSVCQTLSKFHFYLFRGIGKLR